ncbi:MAG: HAD family hydrolase [Alkalispirochaetaceae bacterium]
MRKEVDAIVLDYGNVLTLPQRTEFLEEIRADLGCSSGLFRELYGTNRDRLDSGELDLEGYWKETLLAYGYEPRRDRIERFSALDRESWSSMNEPMLRWVARLKGQGYRPFLLSNMPVDFFHLVVAGSSWYATFEAGVISGLLGMVKPRREIYEHLLSVTGTAAERTLFIDDLPRNVAAARELGIEAVLFRSPEQTLPLLAREYGLPNGQEVTE